MHEGSFDQALDEILATDRRYHRDAYCFLTEALTYTQKKSMREPASAETGTRAPRVTAAEKRNVSGSELLEGVREYALMQFGPMVITVFEEWGIRSCRDFGEMVFLLVEHKFFKKSENDSPADFENGYDFNEVFRKPFQPRNTAAEPPKTAAV